MNKQQAAASIPGYLACCFHPREVVVGVCAHCLKDRLLLLLAAAATANSSSSSTNIRRSSSSSISLPKVFALGSSFLQRLDSRHHRNYSVSDDDDDDAATASVASLDDSFISIKFEDNGKATWDSQSQHKAAAAPARSSSTVAVVAVEHAVNVKRGGVTRWRKQVVGRLLQLARWRRSSAAACHVGGLDGKKAKGRGGRGWIRSLTLTRRRPYPWS